MTINLFYKWASLFTIWTFFSITFAFAGPQEETSSEHPDASQKSYANPDVASITQNVVLPELQLIRQDGTQAKFPHELNDGKPVVLTFIYSSCKAACPIMSHIMKGLQNKLGGYAKEIHMASISLDPEFDTPDRLNQYARQVGAGPQWIHYTGLNSDIVKLEKSFNIYGGDKMNHLTVFFVRRSPDEPWLRIVGFVSPDDIIKELGIETQVTNNTDLPN